MRTDLGWTPGSDRHVPQPRLVRGVPGAGPGRPARMARPAGAPSRCTFLDRELRGPSRRGPRRRSGAFLGADPDGLVFVPNATTGVERRAALAPLRARRRAADHRPRVQRHPEHDPRRRGPRRGAGRARRAPLPDDRRRTSSSRRVLGGGHAAHPPGRHQPRHQPDGARPADRAHRPRARRARDRHARRRRARPGHGAARPRRARRPRTTRATATSGCAGPKGAAFLWVRADRRERIQPTIVSHGANATRTDRAALPARVRLGRDRRPDRGARRCPPRSTGWPRLEPGGWPAVMAANHALALEARDRLVAALGGPLPGPGCACRVDGGGADPGPAHRRGGRLAARGALRRGPDRGPDRGLARCRAARPTPTDPPRSVLVRVSAQRYNESGDIERLVAALGRRLDRRVDRPEEPARDAAELVASDEAGGARPGAAQVVAENGCGTQGLPRSASYSTTMNGAPGRRCAASDRIDGHLPVARARNAGCWPRPGRRAAAGRAGRSRSATRVVSSVAGNRAATRRGVRPQRTGVAVHGDDPRARPEQVGEGKGERTLPGPDVRPRRRPAPPMPPPDRARRGRDGPSSAGVLEAGRDAVDRQLDEAQHAARAPGRRAPWPAGGRAGGPGARTARRRRGCAARSSAAGPAPRRAGGRDR